MPEKNRLIIGSSEQNADLYYATHFIAPDPFVLAEIRSKKYLLTYDLEFDRARKEAAVHKVLSIPRLSRNYQARFRKIPSLIDLLIDFLKQHRVKQILVPCDFPVQYYVPLKRAGFRLSYKPALFCEKRLTKHPQEVAAIQKSLRATERAVRNAIQVLKRSVIIGQKLYFCGKTLTSEILKTVIQQSLLQDGCFAERMIVACGNHSIDPHHCGRGPLYANQPIIMDIFPRHQRTLYYGDFTRTVVRGKASPELKRMYAAVQEGQKIAFQMIRAGMASKKIHAAIQKRFLQLGFKTGVKGGRMQGFFHSTGHGLGLEIHEPPRISLGKDVLKAGQVVTVEPGLYYKGVGGVRLEDVVLVTEKGCKRLTHFPQQLEI